MQDHLVKNQLEVKKKAKFVLELNAGVFKELGFDIGDKIIF